MTGFRTEDRTDPPWASDEAAMLMGFLNYQRDTLRWKCAGLTADQLSASAPPSVLTLGGLLKHLAVVEAGWLCGRGHEALLVRRARPRRPRLVLQLSGRCYADAVVCLVRRVDRCVRSGHRRRVDWVGRSLLSLQGAGRGETDLAALDRVSSVEEYARHNGHADLLRESIDGVTGE